MVDEAKAFCPGCGNAFVTEEKRSEASKFEKMGGTVQFGQTVYNQMLEDMGLNIAGSPNPAEKRVEVITPVRTETVLPIKPEVKAAVPTPKKKPVERPKKTAAASNTKWYILIGLAVVFLLPVSLASAVLFVIDVLSRLK